ncbi:ubiquitin carboxyl-terminal hydrolase CYLD isoform X1 [Oncorhynchus masou masou]|uniref:ubiquitin carboxyl-terminal hydrolase CYLD isoform X1 n=2 Tax=Oncorhynchus masou masou TaxID=90313 RepID=UPI003183B3B3
MCVELRSNCSSNTWKNGWLLVTQRLHCLSAGILHFRRGMESKREGKDKFFIVTRGKARKGFARGCIGRVEAEMQKGELMGLLYGGGSSGGNPKSGGMVKMEDTYPLTCHQAQLLLFVSPSSKRLELLCNPQLFLAICVLSQDDLVVVKHKKGHQPGLVRNIMLIGKKENQGDLLMLGFEVEFVQDSNQTVSSKKPATLPLFSAADIVQVVPAYSVGLGPSWKDSHSEGLKRKAGSRISSMPNMGSCGRQVRDVDQSVTPPESLSHHTFDVGSLVEVTSNTGITVYGVIQWMGVLSENKIDWAGIELDYEVNNCSDGTYGGQRYFTCKGGRALFLPLTKCSPDGRFLCLRSEKETFKATNILPVTPLEETDENVPPIPESEALSLLVGKMKGIQGHYNSCYLDATLFSLFSSSMTLDSVCHKPADTEQSISRSLRRDIVNCLRRQGFVPAESVMNFRKQLGCDTFVTEEKDPEEFITILIQRVLCMEPLLKLRSNNNTSQDAYTFQIILDKEQVTQTPTVQQLLDTSFLSCGLKFEEIPSCLMVQMPRFGKKYKMFPHIIPSTELDITDLLYNSPRECFLCGRLAEYECSQCLQDRKLQPGRVKQYCTTCKTQVHTHPSRKGHCPRALAVPAEVPADAPLPRHMMQLFAVLCIHTSHYVSFVKYGPGPRSWLFFDSMADRCGDDHSGYNIPEIRACPEVGDFLSQSEEELVWADPSQAGEPVRRLLCDSYMCLYQSASMALYR